MMGNFDFVPLWAVHILDGALAVPWLVGGFVVAALLLVFGAWRIRDEEIPQAALMSAAFFVASLIHVKIGATSAHLLLNGLLGVILGRRAALAIPVGILMQAVLIGHGGFLTLGVNACVMVVPALAAWQIFAVLQRIPWVRRPWFRASLVAGSALLWMFTLVYGSALLVTNFHGSLAHPDTVAANGFTFHPITLIMIVALAGFAAWVEQRMENAPEFPIGLFIGESAVLLTVFLNSLVLAWGGLERETWSLVAMLLFVLHMPIAVIEGLVVGFLVGFLMRVKPEMLRWTPREKAECSVDALP